MERLKSTSSDGGGDREYVAQREVHTHTVERNSSDSVMDVGCGSTDGHGKNEEENRDGHKSTDAGHAEHEIADELAPAQAAVHVFPISLPR